MSTGTFTFSLKTYSTPFAEISLLSNHQVKVLNNKQLTLLYSFETFKEICDTIETAKEVSHTFQINLEDPSPKEPVHSVRIVQISDISELRLVVSQFQGVLYCFIREYIIGRHKDVSIPTKRGWRVDKQVNFEAMLQDMKEQYNIL